MFAVSLWHSKVSVGNIGSLEHVAPEAGELMAVVDLNDMELLYNARVKAHLLLLEAREYSLSEVNSEAIMKLDLLLEVSLVLLQPALDRMDVTRVLGKGPHCLFASLDIFDVRLGLLDFGPDRLDSISDGLELDEGGLEGAEVVNLALDPMVQVRERVAQVVRRVLQRLDHVAVFSIVNNSLGSVLVHEEHQVLLLISSQARCHATIRLDKVLLAGQVHSHLLLHLLQKGSGLLHVNAELRQLSVKGVLVLFCKIVDFSVGRVLDSFIHLGRRHFDETSERFLDVEALGTRENLELFTIDNEVVLGQFTQKSLQVESALLQEDDILVAHGLLGWHLGQDDSGPALAEAILEQIKFIVSAFDFEFALLVAAFDNVNDVAVGVLWVSN